MSETPTLTLRTGAQIPQVGLGTYKVTENTAGIVATALSVGYRHLDTAQMYRNEPEVGRGWRESGLPREELFLTSKLDNPNHEPEDARRSFTQTLHDLQTDYVDLFLIHWPMPMYYGGRFEDTWHVLEEFFAAGRARAIGVSNFDVHHLERLLERSDVVPAVNQIESHPYFPQEELHRFNREQGIVTEAWSPLARGRLLEDPVLARLGESLGKSPAQVALRWGLQRGDVILPKASTATRQKQNLDIYDFELTEEEMAQVSALSKGEAGRTGTAPDLMDRL